MHDGNCGSGSWSEAIKLLEYSRSQIGIDASTGKRDVDGLMTGKFRSQWARIAGLAELIDSLCESHGGLAPIAEILEKAGEMGISEKDANRLIAEMQRKGEICEPRTGYLATVGRGGSRSARRDGGGDGGGDDDSYEPRSWPDYGG
jgi:DNA replicative helicase MCM subunit Mcm2 (Cdc46/Mcm family)